MTRQETQLGHARQQQHRKPEEYLKMSPTYISLRPLLSIIALTVCATAATIAATTATNATTTTNSSMFLKSLKDNNNNSNNNQTVASDSSFMLSVKKEATSSNSSLGKTISRRLHGDHLSSASLLRPSFIRNLLGPHKQKKAAAAAEEEEEEITQTIMVPINPEDAQQLPKEQKHWRVVSNAAAPKKQKPKKVTLIKESESLAPPESPLKEDSQTQPDAEASLRLTSTDIGGLLNDREAPEFYRERELGGDGVSVGEEQTPTPTRAASSPSEAASLGTAASGPFGSHFMGDYGAGFGPGAGAGGDAAALYRHRLSQAASEAGYAGAGGFDHRFGQQSFGADEGQYGSPGGLMRSPNEYSEVSNYGGGAFGGGYSADAHQASFGSHGGGGGGGDGDFSPHSGLLRAGSEGAYGGGPGMMGADYGGPHGPGGESEFVGGQSAGFFGDNGRLQAHASYNPYMQSGGDYTSRFGQHYGGGGGGMMSGSFGMDQRGFASQTSHQIAQQRKGRLMPLTPVVPLAEELSSPSSSAGVAQSPLGSNSQRAIGGGSGGGGRQIHEALEEDPTDVSSADEATTASNEHQQRQQALQQHYEGSTSAGGAGGNEDSQDGGMLATTMSINQQQDQSFIGQTGGGGGGNNGEHTMILNVPPQTDVGGSQIVRGGPQMVEFARVGSAGYVGPSLRPSEQHRGRHMMLAKKSGQPHQGRQSASAGSDEQSSSESDETSADEDGRQSGDADDDSQAGANNPAHVGKYIID